MNLNYSLIPLNNTIATWDFVDDIDSLWPTLSNSFSIVTSPKYSFSNMLGFKESDKDSYNLEIELPRFRKESIKLTAENNVLHISAEQDNLKFYHSISIPLTLNTDTIEAKLDHGVLQISAQKAERTLAKTIKIKS
jgi:HSP20 family molecular chaperone IbpA